MFRTRMGLMRCFEDGAQEALTAGPMPETETAEGESTADERFEELVRGEFRDAYQNRIQTAIDRRFKQAKALEERVKVLEPVTKALAAHYGVDERDLPRALEDAGNQRAAQSSQARQEMERQAAQLKQTYPEFDLAKEMGNPRFTAMARAGVDLTTAYEIAHKDELLPGAMAYAARRAAKAAADSIQNRARRPGENGTNAQAAAQPRPKTVAEMSREERAELIRRAMNGEKIVL